MQDWVRDQLDNLKPEDFYKNFNFSYLSRKDAEEKLRQVLNNIKLERNAKNSRKATRFLNDFEVIKNLTITISDKHFNLFCGFHTAPDEVGQL